MVTDNPDLGQAERIANSLADGLYLSPESQLERDAVTLAVAYLALAARLAQAERVVEAAREHYERDSFESRDALGQALAVPDSDEPASREET